MRIHHEKLSGTELSKGQAFGNQRVGRGLPTGTHRVVITKEGDAVTFAIDVDDDGPTDDDMELSVPNIKAFQPALHSKNTRLFFGGGGAFQEIRITFDPPPGNASVADEPAATVDMPEGKTLSDESHEFGGRRPWPSRSSCARNY